LIPLDCAGLGGPRGLDPAQGAPPAAAPIDPVSKPLVMDPQPPPCACQSVKLLFYLKFFKLTLKLRNWWGQIPALIPGPRGAMIRRSTRLRSPRIVNRIRAARQSLGWTQNELARKAGVSARTIHAIEKGRPCRQATKRSILNALGVPWDLREEYFQRARSVRRVTPIEAARSA